MARATPALGPGVALASLLAACGGDPSIDSEPLAGSTAVGSESSTSFGSGRDSQGGVTGGGSTSGDADPGPRDPTVDPIPDLPDDDGGSDEGTGPRVELPLGPPFQDVGMQTGAVVPHLKAIGQWGLGIAWRDFDLDGDEDVFVTGGQLASALLRNEGGESFTLVDSPAIAGLTDTAGASWADVDDDGWPELLVVGRHRGWLLHNDGGGLVDATPESGLGLEASPYGQSTAWADLDGDGNLDLYIARSSYQGDRLYLGAGDGTFTDVSAAFGGTAPLYPLAATFVDYDDDGDLDLYVVHDRRNGNQLWRNDGPGCPGWCMTNVAAEVGADTDVEGMGLAVGDFDGDLDFDLFFTDAEHARLLRNDGGVGFTEVTAQAGVDQPTFGWGALFFDYDGDGRLDIYEGVQAPGAGINRLYRGLGDGTFANQTFGSGAESPGASMSVAHGDFDGDGAPDLMVGNENADTRLYRNRRGGQGRRWLTMELRGGGPVTRDAVGARVVVQTQSGRLMLRQVQIGSGFGSSNSPRLHFGITTDPPVDVEVQWPDGQVSHPGPIVEDELWVIEYPE